MNVIESQLPAENDQHVSPARDELRQDKTVQKHDAFSLTAENAHISLELPSSLLTPGKDSLI